MIEQKHIVIFSHGFGVRQDARGLFSDIVARLPNCECILFDYNTFNEAAKTVTVRPLSEQTKLLEAQVEAVRARHPDAIIDLVCHSQGGVVAGLAQFETFNVRKAILLVPPESMNFERMLQNFQSRPGTVIDLDGMSRLARRDGSFTLVPAEYFRERVAIDPMKLYERLSESVEVILIKAREDEILGQTDFSSLDRVRVAHLTGNHDFAGVARTGLVSEVVKLIL